MFAGTITVWQMAHQGHLSEAGRQESYKEGSHLSPCLPSLGCHASVSMTTRKLLILQWEMETKEQLLKLTFDFLLLLVHPFQKTHTIHRDVHTLVPISQAIQWKEQITGAMGKISCWTLSEEVEHDQTWKQDQEAYGHCL